MTSKGTDINQYIASFPEEAQAALEQVRATIRKVVPEAEEGISYAIPAFKLDGRFFIYFAGYKRHIGLYPVPTGHPLFEKDFAAYKTSGKGAIQFPLHKPMPSALIARIVDYMASWHKEKYPKSAGL